jgi:signal transduction histidine kinase
MMSHDATKEVAPLELWEARPPARATKLEAARLPGLLRALASERRLQVLRVLSTGSSDEPTIARELGISPATVRRELEVLARVGLVREDPRAAEAYQLAHHAIRLLEAALSSASHPPVAVQTNGGAESLLPAPPLACTVCDNRDFVSQVLGQLNGALIDARQYHRRIQEMSSQVLTAHEAERKRIARELHDDTAQALTSIVVRLRLLELSTRDSQVQQNVEELRELTAGALESVRRMAMDLRPAALDDLGLVPALRAYADKFSANWPIAVTVSVSGLQRRLPGEIELVLYRVVQEALANVAKHASASSVAVDLSRRRNVVTLRISDDGVGFQPGMKSRAKDSGLGLFGMQERLALIDGELEIDSKRGAGTTITARVPLVADGKGAGRTL